MPICVRLAVLSHGTSQVGSLALEHPEFAKDKQRAPAHPPMKTSVVVVVVVVVD